MVSFSRLLGRLIMVIASKGHFCKIIISALVMKLRNTVVPSLSDHQKCEELVVAYRRWLLMRGGLYPEFPLSL